ncbi:Anaphase promoting complex subunit 4 [Fasciola gigantica]|uniref:Anaphase-promoting complex subunit 4 n=1 Tax=Fasciola gigantica TaxID=46835 RepID=A0A504X0M6_FASGI|nr:Anaphase promoting complex subunit 4 [Fasciola gigantica]
MVGDFSYCSAQTKQVSKHKISFCSWSPKTDLIALGTETGDVSVHRYKLSCIWESAHSDLGSVVCLAWRPDGQSLCAGHISGTIHLYLTNDGFIYHTITLGAPITHLVWVGQEMPPKSVPGTNAVSFFPDLNALTMFSSDTNFTSSDTFKLSQLLANVDESLTILTVLCDGIVYMYGCGTFHIARWRLQPKFCSNPSQIMVLRCQFSSCLQFMWILYGCTDHNDGTYCMELQQIPCAGLTRHAQQLLTLSVQNSSVRVCKLLLDWSFSQICVSWEDMILEVDAKFTKYGRDRLAQNKDWSLSVELLEFILFGNCPFGLRKFLVEDWTAPNLKRTGTATLKAYESIKTICFQQLQLLLQRLLFHASELLGCIRDTSSYAQFKIPVSQLIRLCSTTGAVLQKTQELYLVIEKSVAHLRAFFKWLYVAIPGLSGRYVPDDFPRVTPTERELVIDFITNYLQPVFVQGELQSYHVDLVEQYIRSGEVHKPLESVVEHTLTEDRERAKLRELINLTTEQLLSEKFPVGMFRFDSKVTLADLIKKNLQNDIDAVFQAQVTGNFSRGCVHFDQMKSLFICRSGFTDSSLTETVVAFHALARPSEEKNSTKSDNDSSSTFLAWKLPVTDTTAHDSFMVMKLESKFVDSNSSPDLSAIVSIDELPSVENPANLPYELIDFQFYTSDLLLLLVCRAKSAGNHSVSRSDTTREPVLSWLVMLPVQNVFDCLVEPQRRRQAHASNPLWSSERSPPSSVNQVRLSEAIAQSNVESLPWHAVRLATNGERSIVLVLFEGLLSCRVYLLERLEPDEPETEATKEDPGEQNQMKIAMGVEADA